MAREPEGPLFKLLKDELKNLSDDECVRVRDACASFCAEFDCWSLDCPHRGRGKCKKSGLTVN